MTVGCRVVFVVGAELTMFPLDPSVTQHEIRRRNFFVKRTVHFHYIKFLSALSFRHRLFSGDFECSIRGQTIGIILFIYQEKIPKSIKTPKT